MCADWLSLSLSLSLSLRVSVSLSVFLSLFLLFQDAANWAAWGIDYVKDDSCSECPNRSDNDDYHVMWQAIQASGRPMVLTVEGNPDDDLITKGGYGNAKRVGHDINANWLSMVSLVDIGSGLWPFAHNSSNTTVGGWW